MICQVHQEHQVLFYLKLALHHLLLTRVINKDINKVVPKHKDIHKVVPKHKVVGSFHMI
jgi:hypothetical protein